MTYSVEEIEINGRAEYGIRLNDSQFTSILFKYGKVSFDENQEDDQAVLHFDYDVIEGELNEETKGDFENVIGAVLIEMIKKGLEDSSLVYKGGTDAD